MVELLVGSDMDCEVCWDVRHLTLNVGLDTQIVLWVQSLSGLSDSNPLPSWVESHFHVMDKGSTCEAEAILPAWFFQSKEPAKQASDWHEWEKGLGSRLRDVADGCIGSAVIAHDISMQVHVGEVHRRVAHKEVPTHFPIDSMRCSFRQTMLAVPIKPGLAVTAEAGGIVGAEGMPRAALMVCVHRSPCWQHCT